MSALDRANQDEADGDLGSAVRRLKSFVTTAGYSAELCERIARLGVRMQDPTEAGKWYLLCDSRDERAEECVQKFIASCGGEPKQAWSQIPQSLRLGDFSEYPERVAQRLGAMGVRGSAKRARFVRSRTWKDRLSELGCLIVCGVLGFLFLVGVLQGSKTVRQWFVSPAPTSK